MEIIPAIDLLGGQCVRLYQGDFRQVTTYGADPLELARRYAGAGPRRLHVVDLDGARSGAPVNLEVISRLARDSGMLIQAGGGVRDDAALDRLLDAGVERVVVGSVAVTNPGKVTEWLQRVGAGRLVLAFDVRCPADRLDPRVATHGWRDTSPVGLWDIAERYLALGALGFLCTDIGRDGTLGGPHIALYAECVRRFPQARWQASGGLAGAADLPALAATGVAGAITGRALLDGRLTLEEVGRFSRGA
jgi:phosphoribosylformimino-5-aminoimidazole carboxamide ribotide isomerase